MVRGWEESVKEWGSMGAIGEMSRFLGLGFCLFVYTAAAVVVVKEEDGGKGKCYLCSQTTENVSNGLFILPLFLMACSSFFFSLFLGCSCVVRCVFFYKSGVRTNFYTPRLILWDKFHRSLVEISIKIRAKLYMDWPRRN